MAKDYSVQSSHADIQVTSATSVLDVTRFGILTKPSGVLVYVNVPQANVTAAQAGVTLQAYALLAEQALKLDGVRSMRPEQDTDDAGLLADFMVVTVGVDSDDPDATDDITTDVRILTRYFAVAAGFAKGVATPIEKARAGLAASL